MLGKWMKQSIGARLLIIGFLIIVFFIPAAMIQSLIRERQERRDGAINEVSAKWGQEQTLTGPILSVPYNYHFKNEKGEIVTTVMYAHFLPENLHISGKIFPEVRNRGIYEVVLYHADLHFEGIFRYPNLSDLKVPQKDIIWQDTFISVGITDMKGIKDLVTLNINDTQLLANSGIETNDVLESGISRIIDILQSNQNVVFSFDLKLNGSSGLLFTPIGKETSVEISSEWSNPSFIGEFLPESREIDNDGFNAKWKIFHLNRNYPQKWLGDKYKIQSSSFGVNLLLPVDEYQKNMRTAKYSFMFIGLTFLSFFMIELLNRKIIHPIQYLLIGFSLLVFYTLLLSFSEHMLFKYAYFLASIATVSLISTYTKSVLKSNLHTSIILGILVLLYGYLYIVLQLQDFALLMGGIGLFVILAVVMYLTRKIDWFSGVNPEENIEKKAT